MDATIDTVIQALATKAQNAATSHEAMQFAQAALNLAHVKATVYNCK